MKRTWDDLRQEIQSFADLEPNWDSYGSLPISEGVIERAIAATIRMEQNKMSIPYAVPSSNGGIQFEWDDGANYVYLGVEPDCTTTIYHNVGNE